MSERVVQMTPESWESLMRHADVDVTQLRVTILKGPMVTDETASYPLLVLQTDEQYDSFNEWYKENYGGRQDND